MSRGQLYKAKMCTQSTFPLLGWRSRAGFWVEKWNVLLFCLCWGSLRQSCVNVKTQTPLFYHYPCKCCTMSIQIDSDRGLKRYPNRNVKLEMGKKRLYNLGTLSSICLCARPKSTSVREAGSDTVTQYFGKSKCYILNVVFTFFISWRKKI